MARSPDLGDRVNIHYDLTDLRVFVAVAEEGSLSRGALRSHLSTSSVSLRLKELESSIGTQLFTRGSRGVVLTQAGVVMLEHARRCLVQLEQMHVDLMPFSRGLAGHLTVFANNNVMNGPLPGDLGRFFRQRPSVRITLEEHLGTDIVAAVASERAELGIVALDGDHPELHYVPYCEDEFVVIAPADSAIVANAQAMHFADCLDLPFVGLQNGSALHAYLVNHAAALGRRLDLRVQVAGYRAVAILVAAGAGISIVPRSVLLASDLKPLHLLTLDEPWAHRHHRLCFLPQVLAQRQLVGELVETLRARSAPA